jgi:regulator of protease activity HflC (stomatin/prohibitin superfamily)
VGAAFVVILILVLVALFVMLFVKIAREYERGVIFRLGRLLGVKGPGMFILIPLVDRFVRVDLRTVTLAVPPQEVITRDNVTVKVTAVCYFRVLDAAKAVVQVENYLVATSQIAQTTLRSVLGQVDLDQLLSEREQINERLQHIIDQQTTPWGVKVSVVEVKDVELPQQMQRALARQAEAERERRAKIIAAEGELQASEKLSQAAAVIASEPTALQLRYLQTLTEISSERTSTMIIPVPLDLFEPFLEARRNKALREGNSGPPKAG